MDDALDRIDSYLDTVPRTAASVEEHGPFTLFVGTGPWPYYARPRRSYVGEFEVADVTAVRARQRSLEVPQALEWIGELAPSLAEVAVRSGLEVLAHPLMSLTEPRSVAVELARGTLVRLVDGPSDDLALMQAVQAVAFATMGAAVGDADVETLDAAKADVEIATVEFLRERLRHRHTVMAAAVDGAGRPSAVGMHQPVGAVTEIVGVATVPWRRRQGLGTAVTALLVTDAHRRGTSTVFLSATDAAVARIYEAVGFTTVATALVAQPHR